MLNTQMDTVFVCGMLITNEYCCVVFGMLSTYVFSVWHVKTHKWIPLFCILPVNHTHEYLLV